MKTVEKSRNIKSDYKVDQGANVTYTFLEPKMAISKKYIRGETIYQVGESPNGLYYVNNGLVCLKIIGPKSGKEHILRLFKEGQFFGHRALFSNNEFEKYHGTALALNTTELSFYPKETIFKHLENYPGLYKEVLGVLTTELRKSEEKYVMILDNQVIPRVAQTLIYLKEVAPSHPWTREEIANCCGSTTSTVIKAMAELEAKNLIQQEGRNFQIKNKDELISIYLLN